MAKDHSIMPNLNKSTKKKKINKKKKQNPSESVEKSINDLIDKIYNEFYEKILQHKKNGVNLFEKPKVFVKDFLTFMNYLINHREITVKKNNLLPLKYIRAINKLLINKSKILPRIESYNVKYIHLFYTIAIEMRFFYIDYDGRLQFSEIYNKFLNYNIIRQFFTLVINFIEFANWDLFYPTNLFSNGLYSVDNYIIKEIYELAFSEATPNFEYKYIEYIEEYVEDFLLEELRKIIENSYLQRWLYPIISTDFDIKKKELMFNICQPKLINYFLWYLDYFGLINTTFTDGSLSNYMHDYDCILENIQFYSRIKEKEIVLTRIGVIFFKILRKNREKLQKLYEKYDEDLKRIEQEESPDLMRIINQEIISSDDFANDEKIDSLLRDLSLLESNFDRDYTKYDEIDLDFLDHILDDFFDDIIEE